MFESKENICAIYKTVVIRAVSTYGSEKLALTKHKEQLLGEYERRVGHP